MNREDAIRMLKPALLIMLMLAVPVLAKAQTTQFTYQGNLRDAGTPANGAYDFQFKLFDTATVGTGTQQGSSWALTNITVAGGIFSVLLDFGACPMCFNGADRFLEISVKPVSGSTFTTLGPRQPITSSPYAVRGLSATTADGLSVACVNCVTSDQIQSLTGAQITGTIPPESIPAASISSSAILDGTIVNADINASAAIAPSKIAGTAAILGSNTFTTTQSISNGNLELPDTTNVATGIIVQGGFPLLHNFGGGVLGSNIFLGRFAGNFAMTGSGANTSIGTSTLQNNTTGSQNTAAGAFTLNKNTTGNQNTATGIGALYSNLDGYGNTATGMNALLFNTSGSENTALGYLSMQSNTQGFENTAVGDASLYSNTSGNRNTAIGAYAGFTTTQANANTTGSNNTFVGFNAGPGTATQLSNSTAIGANALVSVSNALVLGSSSTSVGIGTSAPTSKLDVNGNVTLGSAASNNTALTIRGPNVPADPNSAQDIRFSFASAGSSAVRAYRGSAWDTYLSFLTNAISQGSDSPQVRMTINDTGNVGVNTTDPLDKLHVAGDIRVNGCLKNAVGTQLIGSCVSDERLKKNVVPFSPILEKLSQLQPVYFEWRADEFPDFHFGDERSFGLIAQEVEKVLPELVVENEAGYKMVQYHELPLVAIQALRELNEQKNAMAQQVKHQQEQMQNQQAEIQSLKSELDSLIAQLKAGLYPGQRR